MGLREIILQNGESYIVLSYMLCSLHLTQLRILSRQLSWAGHVARMEQSRNAYRVLVGKREEKRPLGRLRHRWEDNIKMDLKEVGSDARNWMDLAQDRDQ